MKRNLFAMRRGTKPKNLFSSYGDVIFLFVAALFIRFPFFFRDYIDQDESTFILMGQSIADGYLPYDHLWDLKPPLLFYIFGLIETIVPYSFIAIRFFGTIVIFLSALLLFRIAAKAGLKNGFLIALGYVVLSSEFGSLQGVMSEHLTVFFFLAGLSLLNSKNRMYVLGAGVLFGCSALCKLNYAYAIAALLIFYFIWQWIKENALIATVYSFLIGGGILMAFLLVSLPFIIAGKTQLFIDSVFLAPVEYGQAMHYTFYEKLKNTWWVVVLTLIICFAALRNSGKENRFMALSSTVILAATVYTFFSTGIVNGHYLVQIYPYLLLLVFGILIKKEIRIKPGLAAVLVLLLSIESIVEYYNLIRHRNNFTEYRASFEAVRELKERNLHNEKIFFADYHIGYWLLRQYPLTKSTTHPSNISRPYLFKFYNASMETPLQELKYLLETVQPKAVVSKTGYLHFFAPVSPENEYFNSRMEEAYRLVYQDQTDRIYIWVKKYE